MDTKLTIKLEKSIIEQAKLYASVQKTSLSSIIESYLAKLTISSNNTDEIEPSKFAQSLSLNTNLPKNFDYKQEIGNILSDKYKL
jgi:Family of unknown function (DUF6364)